MHFSYLLPALIALATASPVTESKAGKCVKGGSYTTLDGCTFATYCNTATAGHVVSSTTSTTFDKCIEACEESGIYCNAVNYDVATQACDFYDLSSSETTKLKGTNFANSTNNVEACQ